MIENRGKIPAVSQQLAVSNYLQQLSNICLNHSTSTSSLVDKCEIALFTKGIYSVISNYIYLFISISMVKDFLFCLQEAVLYFISKKPWTPKQSSECFVNPPCRCANPGNDLKCEECPHLEACLSSFKLQETGGCNVPYIPDILTNFRNNYETIYEVKIREKSKSSS